MCNLKNLTEKLIFSIIFSLENEFIVISKSCEQSVVEITIEKLKCFLVFSQLKIN